MRKKVNIMWISLNIITPIPRKDTNSSLKYVHPKISYKSLIYFIAHITKTVWSYIIDPQNNNIPVFFVNSSEAETTI